MRGLKWLLHVETWCTLTSHPPFYLPLYSHGRGKGEERYVGMNASLWLAQACLHTALCVIYCSCFHWAPRYRAGCGSMDEQTKASLPKCSIVSPSKPLFGLFASMSSHHPPSLSCLSHHQHLKREAYTFTRNSLSKRLPSLPICVREAEFGS